MVMTILVISIFLLGFIFYLRFRLLIKGTPLLPVKVKKIEKYNMFYAKIGLAILGYKLYKVETSQGENLIYISRDKLELNNWVSSLMLDPKTYYVKLTPKLKELS